MRVHMSNTLGCHESLFYLLVSRRVNGYAREQPNRAKTGGSQNAHVEGRNGGEGSLPPARLAYLHSWSWAHLSLCPFRYPSFDRIPPSAHPRRTSPGTCPPTHHLVSCSCTPIHGAFPSTSHVSVLLPFTSFHDPAACRRSVHLSVGPHVRSPVVLRLVMLDAE
jgi:hypothetical protein